MRLIVEYYTSRRWRENSKLDARIERLARKESEGSGMLFPGKSGRPVRDISFYFRDKKRGQDARRRLQRAGFRVITQ